MCCKPVVKHGRVEKKLPAMLREIVYYVNPAEVW